MERTVIISSLHGVRVSSNAKALVKVLWTHNGTWFSFFDTLCQYFWHAHTSTYFCFEQTQLKKSKDEIIIAEREAKKNLWWKWDGKLNKKIFFAISTQWMRWKLTIICGKSTFPWRTISIIWTIWILFRQVDIRDASFTLL